MLEQRCLLPNRLTHGPTLLCILIATLTLLITHSSAQETYSGMESYAIYPGWTGLSMQEGLLQLRFRTSSSSGLLLYAEGDDGGGTEALAIMLEGGRISVKVQRYLKQLLFGIIEAFDSTPVTKQFYLSEQLNDNEVHTLSLQRTPGQVTVSVLDRSSSKNSDLLANRSSTIGGTAVYVGGLPPNVTSLFATSGHFTGCLEDIQFINNSSDTSSLVSVTPLVQSGVVDGCSDPCSNVSCGGGVGTCVAVLPDSHFCDCSSTQMGGADCTEDLSQHRLNLTLDSHLCYDLDKFPFINQAASVRLLAPLPQTGTVMTGFSSTSDQFNLYIEDSILKLEVILNKSDSVKFSASQALNHFTSYQIDFDIRGDSIEFVLATISGSAVTAIERLSRNISFSVASIFSTICVGGTMLELPYYAGVLERVIYNTIPLSDARIMQQATVESPVNLISFSAEIPEPPLMFKKFNFANYRRITFEIRLDQDNSNSGSPIETRNDDVLITFGTLNGQFVVLANPSVVVGCEATPVLNDFMWHRIDILLTRNGNDTADFYITVDNIACASTSEEDRGNFGMILTSLINSNAPLDFGVSTVNMLSNMITKFIGCFRNIEFRETASSEPVRPDLASAIRSEDRFGAGEECYACRQQRTIPCQGGEMCVDCGFMQPVQCLNQTSDCPASFLPPPPLPTPTPSVFSTTTQTPFTTMLPTSTDDDSTSSTTQVTTSVPSLTSAPLGLYIGVAVGVAVVIIIIVILFIILLCACVRIRAGKQGFYKTEESNGKAVTMLHYSASLRQIASEQVTMAETNGVSPMHSDGLRAKEFYM